MNAEERTQRMDLVRRIQDLDRRLGEQIAEEQGRTRRITASDYSFPWGSLILTLVFAGWWLFGGAIHTQIYNTTKMWAMILAAVVGVVTVILIIRWLLKKMTGRKAPFTKEESQDAHNLRSQRDALKRELVELDKRLGYKG